MIRPLGRVPLLARWLASLSRIIRGERVLLDADLAELYGVKTKRLNEAVARNRARFPGDFMFRLSADEARNLRSQFATSSSRGYGGRRYLPNAFTEQGVAMLRWNSPTPVIPNVRMIRTFTAIARGLLGTLGEPSVV